MNKSIFYGISLLIVGSSVASDGSSSSSAQPFKSLAHYDSFAVLRSEAFFRQTFGSESKLGSSHLEVNEEMISQLDGREKDKIVVSLASKHTKPWLQCLIL